MAAKKSFPKGSVCKPCWELKYCPYGYLVEYFPSPHGADGIDIDKRFEEVKAELAAEQRVEEKEIYEYFRLFSYLDPERNRYVSEFDPEDVGCKIFGHTCPVFFMQSAATETREYRREGRYIPREVMLKVVRRDNHICQVCHTYVPDDQVEFDHIIPVAKGGATSVENIRLLCRTCNRKKGSGLTHLLRD